MGRTVLSGQISVASGRHAGAPPLFRPHCSTKKQNISRSITTVPRGAGTKTDSGNKIHKIAYRFTLKMTAKELKFFVDFVKVSSICTIGKSQKW